MDGTLNQCYRQYSTGAVMFLNKLHIDLHTHFFFFYSNSTILLLIVTPIPAPQTLRNFHRMWNCLELHGTKRKLCCCCLLFSPQSV